MAAAALLAASPGRGGTLHVPADHSTIQAAVLAASARDTVLVAPGRYPELVRMRNGVVLRSAQGPDSTFLVSPGIAESILDERIIECLEGIDRTTVIDGFTFDSNGRPGCAIFCDHASPTIRGNRISSFGWGINLRFSEALLEENVIEHCRSFGILVFASSPDIFRNTVRDCKPNGINIGGKESRPRIGGSRENANKIYANGYAIVNQSRNDIDATWNDWGWEIAAEMDRKGYPQDITAFLDGNDKARTHRGKGKVDYRDWIRPEGAGGVAPVAGWGGAVLVPVGVALVLVVVFVAVSRRRRTHGST